MANEIDEKKTAPKRTRANEKENEGAGADNLPVTDSENVEPEETGETHQLEVEKQTRKEVAKLNINEAVIAEVKEKYKGLTVSSLEDKEVIEKVKEGKKIAQQMRIKLERKRKLLKADYISIGKGIDAAAGLYEVKIAEIENPLDVEIAKIKQWEKDEEERLEKEAAEVLNKRVDMLKASGMQFNGSYYVLGDTISMDVTVIKKMSEADFEFFNEKVKAEKARIDKAEADRIEAERLENERRDNEARELREKQEALDRQREAQEQEAKQLQEQRDQMRRDILAMREQMAHGIGLIFNPATLSYEFKNKYSEVVITKDDMANMEAPDFTKFIADNTVIIQTAKNNEQIAIKKENEHKLEIQGRIYSLLQLGMEHLGVVPEYCRAGTEIKVTEGQVTDSTSHEWTKILEETTQQVEAHLDAQDKIKQEEERRRKENEELYMQKSADLVAIGMTKVAGAFVRKNEFDDAVSIGADEVAVCDMDTWAQVLSVVTVKVEKLNELTEQKRRDDEAKRKAALPEITQVRNYLNELGAIATPEVTNPEVLSILKKVTGAFANAMIAANNELRELEESNQQ